jgi:hypothetical protein
VVELRKGDIVTFKAVVESVAAYDGGQQIMAKILPKGAHIGWCLQHENGFEPHTLTLKVGDMVRMTDRPGHTEPWEVMALFDNKQAAVKKRGEWPVQMANTDNLRRI